MSNINKRRGRPPIKPDTFLRHILTQKNIDTKKLALIINCNRNHLNKILSGRILPRRELASRLASAIDIDPCEIWLRAGKTQT